MDNAVENSDLAVGDIIIVRPPKPSLRRNQDIWVKFDLLVRKVCAAVSDEQSDARAGPLSEHYTSSDEAFVRLCVYCQLKGIKPMTVDRCAALYFSMLRIVNEERDDLHQCFLAHQWTSFAQQIRDSGLEIMVSERFNVRTV